MFDAAGNLALSGWFEYAANITTIIVNVGAIAVGIWAYRHWKKIGRHWEQFLEHLRNLVLAFREYTRIARDAARRTARAPERQNPSPVAGASTDVRSDVSVGETGDDTEPEPAQVPEPPPEPKPEPEPLPRPGCLGYVLTLTAVVLIVTLLGKCGGVDYPTTDPKGDPPPVTGEVAPPEPPPVNPGPKALSTTYTVPRLRPEVSCKELAARCSPERTENAFSEVVDLNQLTKACSIRYGEPLELPLDWKCPDPLR